MPGGFAPHTGSSPATNNLWFGGIADRLNFLTPNDPTLDGGNPPSIRMKAVGGLLIPANYGNLWTAYLGCSFGSTTTAPDGTTANSVAIVEDGSNGRHYTSCTIGGSGGYLINNNNVPTGPLRLSAYLKANGRRACLEVMDGLDATGYNGVYAIFDLAGGQVSVGATFAAAGGSSSITPIDAQIVPYAPGWYRCSLDFAYTNIQNGGCLSRILLDNGTGTAARSTSYAGNSSSGVFVWKTNLMPVAAYSMGNQVFFDDFTSLSTIDVNNTQAPGFNWYPGVHWTNFFTQTPTPSAASFSITGGTILNILVDQHIANGVALSSTIETTPGSYIGNVWKPPFLWEIRHATRFDLAVSNSPAFNVWGISQGALSYGGIAPNDYQPTPSYLAYPSEIDCEETGYQNPAPIPSRQVGPPIAFSPRNGVHQGGQAYNWPGIPPFFQYVALAPGWNVRVAGTTYKSNAFLTPPPPLAPPPNASWITAPAYPNSGGIPTRPDTSFFDVSQQHTYSYLFLPFYGNSDVSSASWPYGYSDNSLGHSNPRAAAMWCFTDGLMTAQGPCFTPLMAPWGVGVRQEGDSYPMFLGSDYSGAGQGIPYQVDWIRVTQ